MIDESGNPLYKPEIEEPHNVAVSRLFSTLATALDPSNVRPHSANLLLFEVFYDTNVVLPAFTA